MFGLGCPIVSAPMGGVSGGRLASAVSNACALGACRRPVYGGTERFQTDPHWNDLLQFHEYFHGDNGAGLGASHQTGWTGIVARVIQVRRYLRPRDLLGTGLRGNLVFGKAPR